MSSHPPGPPPSDLPDGTTPFRGDVGKGTEATGSAAGRSSDRGQRHGSGQTITTAIEAARGWLRLLAVRQLPSRLRPKVAPSDLVQKTMLEAFLDASRFEGTTPEEVYGWLRRILRNNVHDCIRQFRECRARDVRVERPIDELHGPELTDPALQGSPMAEALAIRAEEDSALAEALATLPETSRLVIRLRGWENLEWDEIGRRIGRSGGAARKIWGRSIVRLRSELNDDGGSRLR